MSRLVGEEPKGVLRPGWSAEVDDYAICGGWGRRGEQLFVADAAGGVHAFEGRSGVPCWTHPGIHAGGVLCMATHPEKGLLATGGQDGRVLLWSAADGRQRPVLPGMSDWVEHATWSTDGSWLAVASSRRVRVCDADGIEVWCSDEHPSSVSAIAWSGPDELATACFGRVTFFGIPAGEVHQRLEWKGSLVSMVLSPDGGIVACGSQDKSVHFWRRSTAEDSMMGGYAGKPSALAFDSTGTLLATGGGEDITVWSFRDGGPEGTRPGRLELHVEPITTLAYAPRGPRLASGARDGGVVVWTLKGDGDGGPVGAALTRAIVSAVHWRPDGRALAALDAIGGVTVWRVSNG